MKCRSFTFLLLAVIIITVGVNASAQITGVLHTCTPSPPEVTPPVIPSTHLSDGHPGGVWSSDNVGVATVNSATGDVFGIHSDSVLIHYVYAGGRDSAYVQVYGQPPGYRLLVGYACAGSTVVVTDDSVGTWTTSNTAIATIRSTGPGTALLYGVSTGYIYIYFTQTNTGCIFRNVDRDSTPVYGPGIIHGPSNLCVGSTITLTDSVTGGNWTSNTIAIATIGNLSGILTGVSAGTDIITYSKTISPCPSITYTTKLVTVNALPVIGAIIGASNVCVGASVAWSGVTAGGTWSTGNPAIATVSPAGLVFGVAAGTAAITYALANSCGTVDSIKTITVSPLPVVGTIAGPVSVCAGGSTIVLTDAAPGGVWSSSNAAVATVGGTGTVTGVASGSAVISYSVTNSCTTAVAILAITVNALPVVAAISGASAVCTGSTVTFTDATSGGVWSTLNRAIAEIGMLGLVTGVAPGVATIAYSASNACGVSTVTKTITVNATPVAGTISGASALCAGSTITLTDAAPGGVWSSSSTGIASVGITTGLLTGVAGGSATIFYTVTNACGAAAVSQLITVNPLPFAGTITGASGVCVGSAITLTDAAPGGAWSSSSPAATVSGGVVTGVSPGTATISYSLTNSCGTVAATQIVAVSIAPVAGTITGATGVCQGSAIILADASGGGVWSSSSTGVATVGGTGTVTGVAGGTATIFYSVVNACGSAIASQLITVSPLPFAGVITGASGVCVAGTVTLTDVTPGGAWSSTSSAIAAVSGGVVTGISAGTIIISYSLTNSCGTSAATKIITVSAAPLAGTITGGPGVCAGAAISLADASPGGIWSSGSTGIARVGVTGIVTGVAAGSAAISYTITNVCGTATATKLISVSALPVVAAISGASHMCSGGGTTSLSDPTTGGIWSSSSSGIATVGSTGVVSITSGSATISYTVSNACGTATATTIITIDVIPVAGSITGPPAFCAGAAITLSDSSASPGGVWISGSTGVATVNSAGIVTGIAAGAATISYSITNACGTAIAVRSVTVNALPLPGAITGPSTVCAGDTIALTDSVTRGMWSSSTSPIATVSDGIVTGISAGVALIDYSVTNICGIASAVKEVTVVRCITGINALSDNNAELHVFPNPNQGTFVVNLVSKWDEEVSVVITDIVGNTIKKTTAFTNRDNTIQFDHSPGIYLLSAKTTSGKYVAKVVVQ